MNTEAKHELSKALPMLKAIKSNCERAIIPVNEVQEFNSIINKLMDSGIDIGNCCIRESEIRIHGAYVNEYTKTRIPGESGIERSSYLTKVDAAIGLLELLPREDVMPVGSMDVVELCRRFGQCARQLTKRHDNRQPFLINDEYDVQDLLHAILRLHFDDVRAEEPVPSFANKSSRTDFYLPEIKTFIEVKYFGQTRKAKKVRSEIIDDVASYAAHDGCQALIVLIYEGDDHIGNPAGFIAGLEELKMKDRPIRVIITH